MSAVTITLTHEEVLLVTEALEAAEYWAYGTHGDPGLPVDNGYLWLPGDDLVDDEYGSGDRYWPEPPTEEEQEAIEEVKNLRRIASMLSNQSSEEASLDSLKDASGVTVFDVERNKDIAEARDLLA